MENLSNNFRLPDNQDAEVKNQLYQKQPNEVVNSLYGNQSEVQSSMYSALGSNSEDRLDEVVNNSYIQ